MHNQISGILDITLTFRAQPHYLYVRTMDAVRLYALYIRNMFDLCLGIKLNYRVVASKVVVL